MEQDKLSILCKKLMGIDDLLILCKQFASMPTSAPTIYTLLRRGGIDTVEELKNTSIEDIKKIKKVGPIRLDIIRKMKNSLTGEIDVDAMAQKIYSSLGIPEELLLNILDKENIERERSLCVMKWNF